MTRVTSGLFLLLLAASEPLAAGQPKEGPPYLKPGVGPFQLADTAALGAGLDLLGGAGVLGVSVEVPMAACVDAKGGFTAPRGFAETLDRAAKGGVGVLAILGNAMPPRAEPDLRAFGACAVALGQAIKGRGAGLQVPLGAAPLPAAERLKPLVAAHAALKAADLDLALSAGPVALGDLEPLLRAGLLRACDAVVLDASSCFRSPQRAPEDLQPRLAEARLVLRTHNGGREVPVAVAGAGWPTHLGITGTAPAEAADFLSRTLLLARTVPGIVALTWDGFLDRGWQPEDPALHAGLLRPDMTPKPAWTALADISRLAAGSRFVARLDAGDPAVWVLAFARQSGAGDQLALWSAHADDLWQVTLRKPASLAGALRLREAGGPALPRSWGLADNGRTERPEDLLRLSLSSRPLILEGALEGVQVASVERRAFPERRRPGSLVMPRPPRIALAVPAARRDQARACPLGAAVAYTSCGGRDWGGPADLGASFQAAWDKDRLLLTVTVDDDDFRQEWTGADTWKGDGLRLAFQALGEAGADPTRYTELSVALTPAGAQVWRRCGQGAGAPGPLAGVVATVVRTGTRVVYDLAFPVAAIDLPALEEGAVVAFALLAEDTDGKERKGCLAWGEGLAGGRDPGRFNWLLLDR